MAVDECCPSCSIARLWTHTTRTSPTSLGWHHPSAGGCCDRGQVNSILRVKIDVAPWQAHLYLHLVKRCSSHVAYCCNSIAWDPFLGYTVRASSSSWSSCFAKPSSEPCSVWTTQAIDDHRVRIVTTTYIRIIIQYILSATFEMQMFIYLKHTVFDAMYV